MLDLCVAFVDALLRKFDLEALEFDLLREVIVLAVVLDIIKLFLELLDAVLRFLDLSLLSSDSLDLALAVLFEML